MVNEPDNRPRPGMGVGAPGENVRMSTVELLQSRIAALAELEGRIPGGIDGIRVARDPELLEFLRAAQGVARLAESAVAAVAGEIARRCDYDVDGSLARRFGERSAVGLVAKQAGISAREAVSLVKVGEATRPNAALSGEELRPTRPRIAEALAVGRLSVPLAELIQDTIAKVASVLWADQAEDLEGKLVGMATEQGWSVADFTR
jgi:hypothetical protein